MIRLLGRICLLAAAICFGVLCLGAANEVFDLGIWDADYLGYSRNPLDDSISTDGVTRFSSFLLQFGAATLAFGLLGLLLGAVASSEKAWKRRIVGSRPR